MTYVLSTAQLLSAAEVAKNLAYLRGQLHNLRFSIDTSEKIQLGHYPSQGREFYSYLDITLPRDEGIRSRMESVLRDVLDTQIKECQGFLEKLGINPDNSTQKMTKEDEEAMLGVTDNSHSLP